MNANSALPLLFPVALIGWSLLRRYGRAVGPQPLDARGKRRLTVRPVILGVLTLLVLAAPHPAAGYLAALLGALAGAGLAYWSAGHTRYEYGPDGQAVCYVPDAWIGGGVFALFALRLLWRLWPLLIGQVRMDGPSATDGGTGMGSFVGSSPLTTGLFLLFAAYQVGYSLLVLSRSKGQRV